jgi:Yip1 domain
MSHLINIFLEPGKVFAELKEKPTFMVPLILLTVVTVAMSVLYFMKVDSAWFIDHTLMASGKEMSAAEIAQAKSFMPGTKTMGIIAAVTTPIGIAVFTLLVALYYFVAGKVTGTALGFKHGMSLASWASMPALLGTVVALVGVLMMSPQTSMESLMLTNLDPLLIQLPVDSPWKKLASSFSLLNFWSIFLAALGWKTWGKTSWAEAISVAIVPSVVIYGAMAAWALVAG